MPVPCQCPLPKMTCFWWSNAGSAYWKNYLKKSATVVRSLFLFVYVDFHVSFALWDWTKPPSYWGTIAAENYRVGGYMDLTASGEAALQSWEKPLKAKLRKRGKELLGCCLSSRDTLVISYPLLECCYCLCSSGIEMMVLFWGRTGAQQSICHWEGISDQTEKKIKARQQLERAGQGTCHPVSWLYHKTYLWICESDSGFSWGNLECRQLIPVIARVRVWSFPPCIIKQMMFLPRSAYTTLVCSCC